MPDIKELLQIGERTAILEWIKVTLAVISSVRRSASMETKGKFTSLFRYGERLPRSAETRMSIAQQKICTGDIRKDVAKTLDKIPKDFSIGFLISTVNKLCDQ